MTTPRQLACLQALGVVPWVRREAAVTDDALPGVVADAAPVVTEAVSGPVLRESSQAVPPVADDPVTEPEALRDADVSAMDWTALREAVAACERCVLHRTRTQTVFGVGDTGADWLIVGEAPGAEEDRRGEPFVGRAGKLLDAMLGAVGLARERVFIANVLKCRPPNNRDPLAAEAAACSDYLNRQIELLQPRLVLALGRVSAQQLLATDAPLARLRGRVHRYPMRDLPLVVTYHPAYLLRSPADKRKAWEDLLLACRVAAGAEGAV